LRPWCSCIGTSHAHRRAGTARWRHRFGSGPSASRDRKRSRRTQRQADETSHWRVVSRVSCASNGMLCNTYCSSYHAWHFPPTSAWLSNIMALMPFFSRRPAADRPAGPAPMMQTGFCSSCRRAEGRAEVVSVSSVSGRSDHMFARWKEQWRER
jgi:hypothetical protein